MLSNTLLPEAVPQNAHVPYAAQTTYVGQPMQATLEIEPQPCATNSYTTITHTSAGGVSHHKGTGRWTSDLVYCNNCCGLCECSCWYACSYNIFCLPLILGLIMQPFLLGSMAQRSGYKPNCCGCHSNTALCGCSGGCATWCCMFNLQLIGLLLVSGTYFVPIFSWSGIVVPLLPPTFWMLVFQSEFRKYIRERDGIPQDCICDCCPAVFCNPCMIARMARQVHANDCCMSCCDPGPATDVQCGGQTSISVTTVCAGQ